MKNDIIELFKHLENSNFYVIMHQIKRNPHIKEYLIEQLKTYPEFGTISNLVKCILKNITIEDLPKCKTCGKTITYEASIKINNGYREYCSCKCRSNNKEVKQKTINTCIKKYGTSNVFSNNEIKDKIKNTCQIKYGVDHIGKHNESHIKQKEIMLEKYGVVSMVLSPISRNKNKITQLSRAYKNMQRFNNGVIPNFTIDEFIKNRSENNLHEFEWLCTKCNTVFKQIFFKNSKFTRCYICNPMISVGTSLTETEIFNYICSLNIGEVISSNRNIIYPLELDVVIPSKKIAIEYNGNYWHSEEAGKNNTYHINKTNRCLEKGYRLIHIFEDEWINKRKIVKSRIKNILGLTKYRIYARKCKVEEISGHNKDEFLEKYHIQGSDKSSVKLGLFYKNRLVAVMTFGKRRYDDKEGVELIRYATISNFNIIGGAGKLLSHYRKQHIGETIISYADKRWSLGNLYKQLGFTLIRESPPNYWYMNNENKLNRLSRQQYMKHMLKDKLEKFDESLTEVENMKNNGYKRIWDCGNYVFELK